MKYGASVAYSYVNEYTDHFGMRSEVMEFDFRPNTPGRNQKGDRYSSEKSSKISKYLPCESDSTGK